eukprot:TRINITY_DN62183_c0_g1_i1.p1 TRINITY_DN62183_c0_g1~~TRINITY_DN62183_c0_g1_i1.p1  ORF type:complete len:242 (-),score=31.99 TRINITY_DN62183_c0_g1_i1:94-819(-)
MEQLTSSIARLKRQQQWEQRQPLLGGAAVAQERIPAVQSNLDQYPWLTLPDDETSPRLANLQQNGAATLARLSHFFVPRPRCRREGPLQRSELPGRKAGPPQGESLPGCIPDQMIFAEMGGQEGTSSTRQFLESLLGAKCVPVGSRPQAHQSSGPSIRPPNDILVGTAELPGRWAASGSSEGESSLKLHPNQLIFAEMNDEETPSRLSLESLWAAQCVPVGSRPQTHLNAVRDVPLLVISL